MEISRIPLRFLLLAAIAVWTSIVSAEMYKWVDADGNTHYTQLPPSGDIQATTIKPPPKINPERAQKRLDSRKAALEGQRKERLSAADKRKQAKQETEQKKAACEQARTYLASYQRPRVNSVDAEGNRTRITEEDRQKGLAEARKAVEERCKDL